MIFSNLQMEVMLRAVKELFPKDTQLVNTELRVLDS